MSVSVRVGWNRPLTALLTSGSANASNTPFTASTRTLLKHSPSRKKHAHKHGRRGTKRTERHTLVSNTARHKWHGGEQAANTTAKQQQHEPHGRV